MTKLKLGSLEDDRPVKVTIELPAAAFQNLSAYARILTKTAGAGTAIEPAKLIVPMIERFMASDRAFLKARRDVNKAP